MGPVQWNLSIVVTNGTRIFWPLRQWAALGRSVCTVLVQLGPAVATIIDRWLAALNYSLRQVPLYNYWGEPE